MLFIRRFPRLLLAGLLLFPAAAFSASAGGQHASPHEGVPEKFPKHPAVGEMAPDFALRDPEGISRALGEYLGRGYLILVFGSATSSNFRKSAPEMNRLARDWERLEVKVLLVYTREAHPAKLRKKVPRNYPERAALAQQTRKDLKIAFPMLVDEWDDLVHKAYGAMPDAAFLLDPRGTIVARQALARASALEKELRRLLKLPEPPAKS